MFSPPNPSLCHISASCGSYYSYVSLSFIQIVHGLPKTRSGKIMRRILRKIANNLYEELGDVSTLANPAVVDDIVGKWMVKAEEAKAEEVNGEAQES